MYELISSRTTAQIKYLKLYAFLKDPPIFFRYRLKDDVREAMYDEVNVFMRALGKRKFLGGNQPNLADLVMFHTLVTLFVQEIFMLNLY